MKKVWVQPKAVVEGFEANEYVAACAEATRCEVPYNGGRDAINSLHEKTHCGVDAGHAIKLDANGNFESMRQLHPGDSDGSCDAFSDPGYKNTLKGQKLYDNQPIYWISHSKSSAGKDYQHWGYVHLTNHS